MSYHHTLSFLPIVMFTLILLGSCEQHIYKSERTVSIEDKEHDSNMNVVTQDGKNVILFEDGTWEYQQKTISVTSTDDIEAIKKQIMFSLVHKSHKDKFSSEIGSPDALKDFNVYQFKIQNPTSQHIKALKGHIEIYDIFGEMYSKFSFTENKEIEPQSQIDWRIQEYAGAFATKEQELLKMKTSELKVKVTIEQILFK